MSILTRGPESMQQTLQWKTDVMISLDGTEQRVALRNLPRQIFRVQYLMDSDLDLQYWKFELSRNLNISWQLPLWAESEKITVPVVGGADSTVDADFTLMDDTFGNQFLLLHPDAETEEVFTIFGRTDTTATRVAGTFTNSYPLGSVIIPIEPSFTQNNSGYDPFKINAARIGLEMIPLQNRVLEGKGSVALSTYNGKILLDRRPQESKEVFSQELVRLDFGGKIQIVTSQVVANITSGRSYKSAGKEDRQFWKLFLNTIKGQQKSFYTSTYRHDMTVVIQPSVGGTTFIVKDDARVADGWEANASHQNLSIETDDGDTQLREIDQGVTDDNGDGTQTIGITAGLTATVPGSTINKVSFLELVRNGSDAIDIQHFHTHRVVKLPVRTIQQ